MPSYAVDDIDERVKYNGVWFTATPGAQDGVGNFGSPFQGTLHGTQTSGSLAFSFSGTSIKVIGSNNIRNVSGVLDPKWECFVDGTSLGSSDPFQYAENNWPFCDRGGLADGPHVLTVDVTVASAQTFWFDYILYTPSSGVSSEGEYVWIEDDDSQLPFGDGWGRLGNIVHATSQKGATFEFDFIGVSLSWYSYIPIELPGSATTASYSIDGGPSRTFSLNGHGPGGGTSVYNQKFFEVLDLPMNRHTIFVTYNGDADHTPLSLDYLVIKNGTGTTPSVANTASGSRPSSQSASNAINPTSQTLGVVITMSSGYSSPTSTGNVAHTDIGHGSKRIIIGVVAGVGAAALILLVLFGFLLLRRRRQAELLLINDAIDARAHVFSSPWPGGHPLPQEKSHRAMASPGVALNDGNGGLDRSDGNERVDAQLTFLNRDGDLPPAYTG